ncbi:TetR family transcriptional regulator [Klebsiella quasipneumoniae]|uniref:TetR family transcriptional regulator n=1 Tax=Klebsiella quasipneumoniae TaxID=1463165 RepID=UPI00388E2995
MITAAAACFAEKGFSATSVREISTGQELVKEQCIRISKVRMSLLKLLYWKNRTPR